MTITNQALYDFLREKLSVKDMEEMHIKMGINKLKWARLNQGQDEWSAKQIGILAEHLGIHWYNDFCKPLQVGGNLTLAESNRLSQQYGEEMAPVAVAA